MGIATGQIAGNLTRDAEVREGNDGSKFVTFSLAVNQYAGKDNDEWVSYFDCSYNSEGVAPYLTKGKQVFVQGELRQRRWDDDGTTRSAITLRVRDLDFGRDPKGSDAGNGGGNDAGDITF